MRIALVGKNPAIERMDGQRHFMGKGGRLVFEILKQLQFDPKEMLFTYGCTCSIPISKEPSLEQIQVCQESFHAELEDFKPDRIVALGGTALLAVSRGTKSGIMEERGIPYLDPDLGWIIPTLNPGRVLKAPQAFNDLVHDLTLLTRDLPLKQMDPNIAIIQTKDEALTWIQQLMPREGDHWRAYDIETTGFDPYVDELLTVTISPNPELSVIFPGKLITRNTVVKEAFNGLLLSSAFWIGHNAIAFDEPFLNVFGLLARTDFDTMLAHYTVDERRGTHGLKKLAREYFGIPDYSKELKKYIVEDGATFGDVPQNLLYKYAAMDTAVDWALASKLIVQMTEEGTTSLLFDFLQPAARVLKEVQDNGVVLDVEYLKSVGEEWDQKITETETQLRDDVDIPDLNVRSYKQVGTLIYDEIGLPVLGSRNGKRPTDDGTLKRLQEQFHDEPYVVGVLQRIIDLRSDYHNRSTYVDGLLKRVDPSDGRVRTQFLVFGSETGRLASKNPNLQNIPAMMGPKIRKAFMASAERVLIEADYSQLELRVAAWYSQDEALVNAFERGEDIHAAVAKMMFNLEPEEEVTHQQRIIAKAMNFGILYGRGPDSVAEALGLYTKYREEGLVGNTLRKAALKEGQHYIDAYLGRFPGLRAWIAKQQELVQTYRMTITPFGRKRRFPLIVNENLAEIKRQAVNTPIQGMASDICLSALMKINEESIDYQVTPLLTVHDSILVEAIPDRIEETISWMRKLMEVAPLETTIPFPVEFKSGPNWGEMEKVGEPR